MKPALVIFDCDGVLVDSEPVTNALLQSNLARHGLELPLDQISALFVGGTMRSVGEVAIKMGATIPDSWLEDIYAEMFASLARGTPKIHGIEALLDRLDMSGIPYAVGSNGPDEKMAITIGQHPELWQRLKGRLYSAHTCAKPKPAPDLYLHVASVMGVSPENCVVVDDSVSGCMGAINAGIKCFGFAEHNDGAHLAAIGATVFHRMIKLPELLGLTK